MLAAVRSERSYNQLSARSPMECFVRAEDSFAERDGLQELAHKPVSEVLLLTLM